MTELDWQISENEYKHMLRVNMHNTGLSELEEIHSVSCCWRAAGFAIPWWHIGVHYVVIVLVDGKNSFWIYFLAFIQA